MSQWMKYDGAGCPLDRNATVAVRLAEDMTDNVEIGKASEFYWGGGLGQIGEYRVIDTSWTPGVGDVKPTNPKDAIASNKLPLHLVSGLVKAYQAIAHFLGNVKYGAHNYRGAGIRNSTYKAAAERHLDAWWEGEENDPADGTPHLANALACINILIEGKHTATTTDDRPPSRAASLAAVRAEFESLMPKIREKYAHLTPYHYTRADAGAAGLDSASLPHAQVASLGGNE